MTESAPINVACVGDSITFGACIDDRLKKCYPSRLSALLGDRWAVHNFGVSGATILRKGNVPYWIQPQYREALASQPDVVVIKLGTNDSKPENWKYKAEYLPNYVEFVQHFQALSSRPAIWLCYPVPAFSEAWGVSDQVIREEIIPMIDEVAKQTGARIIDLYSALQGGGEMFPDTIHPNAEGAAVIAATVAKALPSQRE